MPEADAKPKLNVKFLTISPAAHLKLTEIKTAIGGQRTRAVTYSDVVELLAARWVETGGLEDE